ncbi:MAG: peptide deformylase [Myxococcota bacterium]
MPRRLPLVIYPDAILKRRSADVTELDQGMVDFAEAMAETMYVSSGVGLAAPQVARNVRLITLDVEQEDDRRGLLTLVNPVIVDSHGRTTWEEGCLSFPGISAEVRRRDQIHVQAFDLQGHELDFEAEGLLSICIQHELDHLNGVTFLDRLSPVKRKLVTRQYLKQREQDDDDDALAAIRAAHGE